MLRAAYIGFDEIVARLVYFASATLLFEAMFHRADTTTGRSNCILITWVGGALRSV